MPIALACCPIGEHCNGGVNYKKLYKNWWGLEYAYVLMSIKYPRLMSK